MLRWLFLVVAAVLAEASINRRRSELYRCREQRKNCLRLSEIPEECSGCEKEEQLYEEEKKLRESKPQETPEVVYEVKKKEETEKQQQKSCGYLNAQFQQCKKELNICNDEHEAKLSELSFFVTIGACFVSFALGCVATHVGSIGRSKPLSTPLQRKLDKVTDTIKSIEREVKKRQIYNCLVVLVGVVIVVGTFCVIRQAANDAAGTGLNYAIRYILGDVVEHMYGIVYFFIGLVPGLSGLRIIYQGLAELLVPNKLSKAMYDAGREVSRSMSRAQEDLCTEDASLIDESLDEHLANLNQAFTAEVDRPTRSLDLGMNLFIGWRGVSVTQSHPEHSHPQLPSSPQDEPKSITEKKEQ